MDSPVSELPNVTVPPPANKLNRDVAGEYRSSITATGPDETAETTVTLKRDA